MTAPDAQPDLQRSNNLGEILKELVKVHKWDHDHGYHRKRNEFCPDCRVETEVGQ